MCEGDPKFFQAIYAREIPCSDSLLSQPAVRPSSPRAKVEKLVLLGLLKEYI